MSLGPSFTPGILDPSKSRVLKNCLPFLMVHDQVQGSKAQQVCMRVFMASVGNWQLIRPS